MSADTEREPLLSTPQGDDSTNEDGRMKPGIVSETVAVRISPLTVRGSRAQLFHG